MTRFPLLLAAAAMLLAVGAPAQNKVCIDPGHGGSDPGAVGGGMTEAANVLDTATRIKNWLDTDTNDTAGGGSWSVLRTRSTDVFVSLDGRTTYANSNGAARFLSVHNNAATAAATGIETFCWGSGSSTDFDLRNKIQEEAVAMWPLANRGGKTANYYVIVYTTMPAELHEMAFITNSGDQAYLASNSQRDNHARSEMYGLQRHYGLAKYTPASGGGGFTGIVDNAGSGFSVSANWWAATSTPGYYGADYRTRGTAAVSDAATWSISLPSAGTYRVEAWWSAGANRAAAAPYIVSASSGSTTVNQNQQVNGGKWNSLGNFSFNAGTNTVKLSCWTTAGYYVVADAVRFTKL